MKSAMEVLSSAGLAPVSVLPDRRAEGRKTASLPADVSTKILYSSSFRAVRPILTKGLPAGHNAGLVLLSSVIGGGFSKALTYEEVLQQSAPAVVTNGTNDFDIGGLLDSLVSFGVENPAAVAGAVAILVVPLAVSLVLRSPKPWGVQPAKTAYEKLGVDGNSQLLDIRGPADLKKVGSPDIGGLKKKSVAVVYKGDNKLQFLNKLTSKFREPEKTTLFILDKFDGNSELVAELVTANGFKSAYAIKDGAEGPRGWMNSGLPWTRPRGTLGIDIGNLADAFSDLLGENSDALPVTVSLAAAAGFGLLAFTEVDVLLQLVGSAALLQFVSKKLLFAEDRKETLRQFDEFLNTKIAPKELVGEIQEIGKVLLLSPVNGKALPAPAQASLESNDSPSPKQALEINSVPRVEPETEVESLSGLSRPLSPFPQYPDLRPPTSPTPSKP